MKNKQTQTQRKYFANKISQRKNLTNFKQKSFSVIKEINSYNDMRQTIYLISL